MQIDIQRENNKVSLVFEANGHQKTLPALWLRERAQDETQVDIKTKQRLINPHLLPSDLSIIDANSIDSENINIAFSDGYSGNYDVAPLIDDAASALSDLPQVKGWKLTDNLDLTFDWNNILDDESVFLKSIHDFLQYGYIILKNTPTEKNSILDIAKKYGYVRDTNFGLYFEVYSKPNANDLAYTPVAIGPHTDNPYRDPVPGIQLLHCLINETSGGLSTLVDSISVAEKLKSEDPKGYELLAKIAVRYRFFDDNDTHIAYHPVIEEDYHGNIMGIHYSPRLDDLPLLDEETLQHYQSARKRLGELFEDATYEKKFKLESGELMMFDNNRVLHGRTSFDPREGERHLQGCYIDRDGPKSLYRTMNRRVKSR